ncbi:unnamed protein product [Discosporangium mesarthrocarpum]
MRASGFIRCATMASLRWVNPSSLSRLSVRRNVNGLWCMASSTSQSLPLFYNDVYEVELPPTHRFPMEKYRMVREGLQRDLGWDRRDGAISESVDVSFHVSPLATLDDLLTTHDLSYVERYTRGLFTEKENRVVGFPWSLRGVNRTLSSVGGTVGAMHAVCRGTDVVRGRVRERCRGGVMLAGHIAGGTHHAFRSRGEGFCVFSDIAVAANVALRDYRGTIKQVLVVDCDVHQGNGNACLFAGNPAVFTFSMHCKSNYFSAVEKSDIDVEMEEGAGDKEYLATLEQWLPELMDRVRPDLIFYQAGVDPLIHDRLGRLKLTREGLRERNRLVYAIALANKTPVVVTMGGGYPMDMDPRSEGFYHIVRSHMDVYCQCSAAASVIYVKLHSLLFSISFLSWCRPFVALLADEAIPTLQHKPSSAASVTQFLHHVPSSQVAYPHIF